MPRLPSTSWAPRPTSASRTRVFTGRDSGDQDPPARASRAQRGEEERVGRGGQQPGQRLAQTRSRSTWMRPTRSTVVAVTGYVYQNDRLMRAGVPRTGTRSGSGLQDVVADRRPGDRAAQGEQD